MSRKGTLKVIFPPKFRWSSQTSMVWSIWCEQSQLCLLPLLYLPSRSFRADVSRRQSWRHCVVVGGDAQLLSRRGVKMQNIRKHPISKEAQAYLVRSQSGWGVAKIVFNAATASRLTGKWNFPLWEVGVSENELEARAVAASISGAISENIRKTSHSAGCQSTRYKTQRARFASFWGGQAKLTFGLLKV